ncbi:MAG: aldo/keto reductase [Chloroflexi bacterium]|nr:aldo/keto reductase [Chloroflexota bacterium]
MLTRPLGNTGLTISVLAFGCGNVGGLFTTEAPTDAQVEALERAWNLGVNWFDTAPQYGDGNSERNLGSALRAAGRETDAIVSTKVRVTADDLRFDIRSAIVRSAEASLERLGTDRVALLQLHNRITEVRGTQSDALSLEDVLGPDGALETMERLRAEGMCTAIGMTALGETDALRLAVSSSGFRTAQVYYNVLNPTAAERRPNGLGVYDYGQLLDGMADQKMGVLAIRVLAAGALSNVPPSKPRAGVPLSPGSEFDEDVRRAQALVPLAREFETSVARLALRYVVHDPRVSSALLGVSNADELEEAAEAIDEGPLPEEFMREWRRLLESDFDKMQDEDA